MFPVFSTASIIHTQKGTDNKARAICVNLGFSWIPAFNSSPALCIHRPDFKHFTKILKYEYRGLEKSPFLTIVVILYSEQGIYIVNLFTNKLYINITDKIVTSHWKNLANTSLTKQLRWMSVTKGETDTTCLLPGCTENTASFLALFPPKMHNLSLLSKCQINPFRDVSQNKWALLLNIKQGSGTVTDWRG